MFQTAAEARARQKCQVSTVWPSLHSAGGWPAYHRPAGRRGGQLAGRTKPASPCTAPHYPLLHHLESDEGELLRVAAVLEGEAEEEAADGPQHPAQRHLPVQGWAGWRGWGAGRKRCERLPCSARTAAARRKPLAQPCIPLGAHVPRTVLLRTGATHPRHSRRSSLPQYSTISAITAQMLSCALQS